MPSDSINIRPGVSILSVLPHLNYKSWYALGEFVDNAVQSYNANRDAIEAMHGGSHPLIVRIDIDSSEPSRITICDNAAGIFSNEYQRAFRTAEAPPDTTGLSEFGMGMKSAACWFAPKWTVRTSALGENVVRTVSFDVADIVRRGTESLEVLIEEASPESHFTEIALDDPTQLPVKRTLGKVKDHLTSIYREFIRQDVLHLYINGQKLSYEEPQVLCAPYFRTPDSEPVRWRKEIHLTLSDTVTAVGFVAIRETASTADAGLALFRRGRVIQGSADEGYRPKAIWGASNSFRYQRLFGEIHLEGVGVSHTKDGLQWDGELEQLFLEKLKVQLDDPEFPLLKQADGYRSRTPKMQLAEIAARAIDSTVSAIREHLPEALRSESVQQAVETPLIEEPVRASLECRTIAVEDGNATWNVKVSLVEDNAQSDWLAVTASDPATKDTRELHLSLSLRHPFMQRHLPPSGEGLEMVLHLAAALAIAEVMARDSGTRYAGTIRRNVNSLVNAFSRP